MHRPNQPTLRAFWHTAWTLLQHPFVRRWVTLTWHTMLSAFWLLSVLVVSNRLGLLTADEQRAFAPQIALWQPVVPLFVHVAFVFMARPSFSWPVLPEMEERDASA